MAMEHTGNLTPSESREKIEKTRLSLINNCLAQLATAAGTEVTKERKALYCRALKDISEFPLKFAFEQALKHLGQFLPSIEQIRTWAEQYKPVDPIAETRRLLTRNDKPPDWQELGRKNGITADEIAQWLEEGKAKQRAHIAKLEADRERERAWDRPSNNPSGGPALSENQRQVVRFLREDGMRLKDIARAAQVSEPTISRICREPGDEAE